MCGTCVHVWSVADPVQQSAGPAGYVCVPSRHDQRCPRCSHGCSVQWPLQRTTGTGIMIPNTNTHHTHAYNHPSPKAIMRARATHFEVRVVSEPVKFCVGWRDWESKCQFISELAAHVARI